MAGRAPGKSGYLTKLGARAKNWKRRFFVVSDNVVKYYVDDTLIDLRGSFTIENAKIQPVSAAEVGKENAFNICPIDTDRVYLVYASTPQERKEWLDVFAEAAVPKKRRSVKDGFLIIQEAGIGKTWKKRYFILGPTALHYHKSDSGGAIVDEVGLTSGTTATPEPDEGERRFVFSVTTPKHKRFLMQASSDTEMRDWIRAIQTLARDVALQSPTSSSISSASSSSSSSYSSSCVSSSCSSSSSRSSSCSSSSCSSSLAGKEVRRGSLTDKKEPEPTYTHSRVRAGWLKKQGAVVKNWKYRFFVLSNGVMFYFAEEEEATPQGLAKGMRPKGHFQCLHAVIEKEAHPPFTFSVTPVETKRKYILVSSSEGDCKRWMRDIMSVTEHAGMDPLAAPARTSDLPPSDEEEKGSDSGGEEERVSEMMSPKDHRLSRRFTSFLKNQDNSPLPDTPVEDYSATDSVKEGFLMKLVRRSSLVRWHKRYFILHDDNLKYYDHKPNRGELSKIKGVMLLGGAELILEKDPVGGKSHVITIQFSLNSKREPPIQLCNPDPAVVELWVAALRKQIADFTKSEPKTKGLVGARQAYFHRLMGSEWRREYWVLVLDHGARIHIFDSHLLKGQGIMWEMKTSTIVLHPNDTFDRPCAFSIHMRRGEEYICAAEDRETLDDWVNLLMGVA